MDSFKKLILELPGLKKVLEEYDIDSSASNILVSLNKAVQDRDKDSIIYCIDVIIEWYSGEIDKIMFSSKYLFNTNQHNRYYSLLQEIRKEIEKCEIDSNEINKDVVNKEPLILLSHSSSNKLYGDALEKFLMGLGIKKDQLIYTSHPLHKIPLDENIYEYLRKNINRKIFMIILWSNEYLNSPACLNEMGAAWVVQCDYTNIYVPDFSFGNPKYHQCAIDTRKMGAILNGDEHCKQNMLELKNKVQNLFNVDKSESEILFLLDSFNEEIKGIAENND